MSTFKTIVVATDFSEQSQEAVDRACELASACGAHLHLLHVASEVFHEPWASYAGARALDDAVARDCGSAAARLSTQMALRQPSPPFTIATKAGPEPADEIIAYAKQHHADLIICGTHGRHGLRRLLLGSVAERVVHGAPCAVMTVRIGTAAACDVDRVVVRPRSRTFDADSEILRGASGAAEFRRDLQPDPRQ